MASILSHPAVPLALAAVFPPSVVSAPVVLAGVLCSILPDFDVVGFHFGVRYTDLLGHRGLTHSIAFAAVLAGVFTVVLAPSTHATMSAHLGVLLFLFLSALSHGLLDAATDGGLGVAFFAPFSERRFFFPFRPIAVSPLGLAAFLSPRALQVLVSELKWIWLPSSLMAALGYILIGRRW